MRSEANTLPPSQTRNRRPSKTPQTDLLRPEDEALVCGVAGRPAKWGCSQRTHEALACGGECWSHFELIFVPIFPTGVQFCVFQARCYCCCNASMQGGMPSLPILFLHFAEWEDLEHQSC